MKRFIVLLLGILMMFSLAACTGTNSDTSSVATDDTRDTGNITDTKKSDDTTDTTYVSGMADTSNTSDTTDTPDTSDAEETGGTADVTDTSDSPDTAVANSKTLVVYFSGSGNTRRVAEEIAEAADADLFELVPVTPYTADDLSWTTDGSRVNREHDDESLRDIPLVSTSPKNFDEYDTVFIGYPIWWGVAAWPVNNFVKNNDFTGKTVIPFATSASSGMGQSGTLLCDMAGTGDWLDGQRFSSGASQSTVESWVKELNY